MEISHQNEWSYFAARRRPIERNSYDHPGSPKLVITFGLVWGLVVGWSGVGRVRGIQGESVRAVVAAS